MESTTHTAGDAATTLLIVAQNLRPGEERELSWQLGNAIDGWRVAHWEGDSFTWEGVERQLAELSPPATLERRGCWFLKRAVP